MLANCFYKKTSFDIDFIKHAIKNIDFLIPKHKNGLYIMNEIYSGDLSPELVTFIKNFAKSDMNLQQFLITHFIEPNRMFYRLLIKNIPKSDKINLFYQKNKLNTKIPTWLIDSKYINNQIDLFNNEKKISIIDPRKKFNNYSAYSYATFITPNLNEVRNLYPNLENIDKEIIVAAKKIIKEYSIKNIIIKRGEKGLTFVNNLNINHLKSVAREVYDVSGAGDTIIACFAAGILGGLTVKESLKLSNRCAAYVISLIGTQPISFDKFSDFFKKL